MGAVVRAAGELHRRAGSRVEVDQIDGAAKIRPSDDPIEHRIVGQPGCSLIQQWIAALEGVGPWLRHVVTARRKVDDSSKTRIATALGWSTRARGSGRVEDLDLGRPCSKAPRWCTRRHQTDELPDSPRLVLQRGKPGESASADACTRISAAPCDWKLLQPAVPQVP